MSRTQYNSDKHRKAVVQDIVDGWTARSVGGRFHAMLATSSIAEAIEYYRLFKGACSTPTCNGTGRIPISITQRVQPLKKRAS